MMYEIDICCTDNSGSINAANLQDGIQDVIRHAIHHALRTEDVVRAVLSVSLVDNATMHQLNLQHLEHDYPTDVISFQLDWDCDEDDQPRRLQLPSGRSEGAGVEGEIIVGSEYAAEMAKRVGWSVQAEITLYVIHGLLHICGYDDVTDQEKTYMRSRECVILKGLGLTPQYPDDSLTDASCSEDTR